MLRLTLYHCFNVASTRAASEFSHSLLVFGIDRDLHIVTDGRDSGRSSSWERHDRRCGACRNSNAARAALESIAGEFSHGLQDLCIKLRVLIELHFFDAYF
jgi:hypothetical protein